MRLPEVDEGGADAVEDGGEGDEDARQAKHAANGHKLTDFNDLHALEGVAEAGRPADVLGARFQ